jgi:hypothetical protein
MTKCNIHYYMKDGSFFILGSVTVGGEGGWDWNRIDWGHLPESVDLGLLEMAFYAMIDDVSSLEPGNAYELEAYLSDDVRSVRLGAPYDAA